MDDIEELITQVGDPFEYDFESCKTRLERMGPYDRIDVIAAILATKGNYGQMAILLGRNRQRVRDYVLSRMDVKAVRDSVFESAIDNIETTTIESALAGDPTDRRFILTTIGKNRGYTTRSESTGKDGDPIDVRPDFSNIPTDAIKAAINQLMDPKSRGD